MVITYPEGMGFDSERLARIAAFFDEHFIQPGLLPNMQLIVAREGTPCLSCKTGYAVGRWQWRCLAR